MSVCICIYNCNFVGQTRIFNESEMYQRAFLHWNRAAVQGNWRHSFAWLSYIHVTWFVDFSVHQKEITVRSYMQSVIILSCVMSEEVLILRCDY